jgi:hypothetical protein
MTMQRNDRNGPAYWPASLILALGFVVAALVRGLAVRDARMADRAILAFLDFFSISELDPSMPELKTVRVVTTVEYFLDR